MDVKSVTGLDMVQVASVDAIVRVTGKLVVLIAQTEAIKAAYNRPEIPKKNKPLDTQQITDSSGELGEGREPSDQGNVSTNSTKDLVEEKEKSLSQVEKDQKDQNLSLADQLPDRETNPSDDHERALQEMVTQINKKIEIFLKEARTILLQSIFDSADKRNLGGALSREKAVINFISAVSEFKDTVKGIPGVKDEFFDLLSLMLKDPETVHGPKRLQKKKRNVTELPLHPLPKIVIVPQSGKFFWAK